MQIALRQSEITRDRVETSGDSTYTTSTTSTAPATTSASTSVLTTTTSTSTLGGQATDVPMHATGAQSVGIKRPTAANSAMGGRRGYGRADVGGRPTGFGGRQARAHGSSLDSEFPTYVLCPISKEVEDYQEQERGQRERDALVLKGGVCDSKIGIEIPRGKVLVARLKWRI